MNSIAHGVSRFVGLDVHAATIAVAVAERGGETRFLGTLPNQTASIHKLIKKLNEGSPWVACYEAGPTGYALYWTLVKAGFLAR